MASSRKNRFIHPVPLILVIVATIAVYGQLLGHEFIANWDDSSYVTNNPAVQSLSWKNIRTVFTTSYVCNYAPVQMLSYMFDYAVWGPWAGGFLLTNLAIHIFNGLLFYHLLLKLHSERLLALIGSALFLLHPVQVETVAWVSQRKNLLAMLFFLLAWEFYRRYRAADQGGGTVAYLAAIVAFFLALLAKSVAVIFPAVIILYDVCFPSGGSRLRLKDKVPFVLAAAAAAWLALVTQEVGGRTGFHGGSPLATFFTMLPVLCRYLGMVVWPAGLSAEYDPLIRQTADPAVVGALLLLAVIVASCLLLMVRNRRLGFWAALFFIGLLPVSQIVPLVTLINDRYLYFPMLGAAALFAGGCVALLRRCETSCGGVLKIILTGMLVLLASVSWQRTKVWQNDFSLWSDAMSKYPGKATIQSAMGDVLLGQGRFDEARQAYERALSADPREANALLNLGALYSRDGDLETGHRLITEVTQLYPGNFKGWANLGNNYVLQGDYGAAEKAFTRAHDLQPDELKVVMLLGNMALLQREPVKARGYYLQVEAKGGNDPENACGLARAEALAGNSDGAIHWLEIAFQRGYEDLEQLNEFGEFARLRQTPAFLAAVKRHIPGKERHL